MPFSHEAYVYDDVHALVALADAFARQGLAQGEAVLIAVHPDKATILREVLPEGDRLSYVDIAKVGRNPARMMALWEEFTARHVASGHRCRGISEPVWPARSAAELSECHAHESLLNVAFRDGPPWRLLCPYDSGTLPPVVIADALASHPLVCDGIESQPSAGFRPPAGGAFPDAPLPEPTDVTEQFTFGVDDLKRLRMTVLHRALRAGLRRSAADDFVLAVNEVATNSARHGGGIGVLRLWHEHGEFVCEVRDRGHIRDPLVGRSLPATSDNGGRGLWMVNQLCDLVQIRSRAARTVVRLHATTGD